MSGGIFNYKDSDLKDDIFGYLDEGDPIPNVFEDREISELVYDLLSLIHDYDWYASGDTCKEQWLQAKTAFKAKWLGDNDERVKRVIDQSIDELKKELYETYGSGRLNWR